jgi:hypothetical protein
LAFWSTPRETLPRKTDFNAGASPGIQPGFAGEPSPLLREPLGLLKDGPVDRHVILDPPDRSPVGIASAHHR